MDGSLVGNQVLSGGGGALGLWGPSEESAPGFAPNCKDAAQSTEPVWRGQPSTPESGGEGQLPPHATHRVRTSFLSGRLLPRAAPPLWRHSRARPGGLSPSRPTSFPGRDPRPPLRGERQGSPLPRDSQERWPQAAFRWPATEAPTAVGRARRGHPPAPGRSPSSPAPGEERPLSASVRPHSTS